MITFSGSKFVAWLQRAVSYCRWGAVQLNKSGLQRGSQIGMRLYSRQELVDLASSSTSGNQPD